MGGFFCDFELFRTASGPVSRPSGEVGQRRRSAAAAGPTGPWHSRHRLDAVAGSRTPLRWFRAPRRPAEGPDAVAPCSGGRHAVDARRRQERRSWVVSFPILRPFGPL